MSDETNTGQDTGGDNSGDPIAIVTKSLTDLTSTVDGRFKALETKADGLDKITKRLDAIEVKVNRPGGTEKNSDDEQAGILRKIFSLFLRKGREALGAEEVKSLRVSDDPQRCRRNPICS